MEIAKPTQAEVDESNDNAVANGYDLTIWSARQIAIDMATYDADLEMYPIEVLEPMCQDWLDRRRSPDEP